MTSLNWRHRGMIKDMEESYRTKEEVDGVEFELAKADEQVCSYDVAHFIMFYGDILDQLKVSPPFTYFQVQVLNLLGMCPSQLTWNVWAFILVFEVVSLHLEVEPSSEVFFFFFSHAQTKNGGLTHFLQRTNWFIIKNMQTNVRLWKNSFIKVYPGRGYHPFFLDEHRRPRYLLKWSPSM